MEAKEFNRLLKEMKRNPDAIEKVYLFYYPRAVRYFSIKYNRDLAEDSTQEFFLKLLDICDKQEYIKFPTSWVYKCIDNIAKRMLQFDSRECALSEVSATSETSHIFEEKYLANTLLAQLSPQEQRIVHLIHWEGYSEKEIASILQISYSNVRKIYSRALKKLKKLL